MDYRINLYRTKEFEQQLYKFYSKFCRQYKNSPPNVVADCVAFTTLQTHKELLQEAVDLIGAKGAFETLEVPCIGRLPTVSTVVQIFFAFCLARKFNCRRVRFYDKFKSAENMEEVVARVAAIADVSFAVEVLDCFYQFDMENHSVLYLPFINIFQPENYGAIKKHVQATDCSDLLIVSAADDLRDFLTYLPESALTVLQEPPDPLRVIGLVLCSFLIPVSKIAG